MADTTLIEWTDATWNPITGCTLVDDGCRHCYAARLAATRMKSHPSRAGLARVNAAGEYKFTGEVRFNEGWLDQPMGWRQPRFIFVCAHGDLFHPAVPNDWIDRVFNVIGRARWHTFQVLTKRPDRARDYLRGVNPDKWVQYWATRIPYAEGLPKLGIPPGDPVWPPTNFWLGTSASDQASADARIPALLHAPAAIRFLSAEPLLGPMDIARAKIAEDPWDSLPDLDWVIVGGESGPGARPMHPDWARSLRDQCADVGTAFFMKQMGGARKPFAEIPDDLMIRQMPGEV